MENLLDHLIEHPETWHIELSDEGDEVLIVPGAEKPPTMAELDAAYEKAMAQVSRECKRGHRGHPSYAKFCHACGAKL